MSDKDCTIKVEVKYSDEAERDGFVSVWSYQLLDRHNAYWAYQYLVKHMGRTGDAEDGVYTVGLFDELVECRRERDNLRKRNEFLESTDLPRVVKENEELRTRLRNSEAQLGEANLQIAILQGKIRNQETSVNEVGHLIAELAEIRTEASGLRVTLNRIVSMGTEELDG